MSAVLLENTPIESLLEGVIDITDLWERTREACAKLIEKAVNAKRSRNIVEACDLGVLSCLPDVREKSSTALMEVVYDGKVRVEKAISARRCDVESAITTLREGMKKKEADSILLSLMNEAEVSLHHTTKSMEQCQAIANYLFSDEIEEEEEESYIWAFKSAKGGLEYAKELKEALAALRIRSH
uniref:Uncharacterized protein n=1 Tax=Palpitomonas bilix TaxID=652834 RepID=A0A7S3D1A3_9EUKA|mmetsp:Transcript_15836/g.40140  ORF Transcript_15836/g.40140 Transcript_15836/m.40140 type:complete len:184 (+) Transcript_15836:163-714(+)|eukprot:CAMPEP_0113892428 /NCGR_PEP_ID=MMETSP0780_2-20120614/15410_1 /TAXON_ID=652834 /ORGANISM="Palpitomonas bilix" /LENGTH=183 /DNA_ID=CAMNT_0000882363 /DNA_START=90 /DNA_END=641 /DNA_ORIENTATION=+ /assembly_acc=CAM_ASM_000599